VLPTGSKPKRYYRSTFPNTRIYQELSESFEVETKEDQEAVEKLFDLLSNWDRVTINEAAANADNGLDEIKVEKMVTRGSLSYNLGILEDADIISRENRKISAGRNIKKAIICLEILRNVVYETKQFTRSYKPTAGDIYIPLEPTKEPSNLTINDALNKMVTKIGQSLLVSTNQGDLLISKLDATRALLGGYNDWSELTKICKPVKLSTKTPMSDTEINKIISGSIGTVLDEHGQFVGIVTYEEIANITNFISIFRDPDYVGHSESALKYPLVPDAIGILFDNQGDVKAIVDRWRKQPTSGHNNTIMDDIIDRLESPIRKENCSPLIIDKSQFSHAYGDIIDLLVSPGDNIDLPVSPEQVQLYRSTSLVESEEYFSDAAGPQFEPEVFEYLNKGMLKMEKIIISQTQLLTKGKPKYFINQLRSNEDQIDLKLIELKDTPNSHRIDLGIYGNIAVGVLHLKPDGKVDKYELYFDDQNLGKANMIFNTLMRRSTTYEKFFEARRSDGDFYNIKDIMNVRNKLARSVKSDRVRI
jgi:hypothetical protein